MFASSLENGRDTRRGGEGGEEVGYPSELFYPYRLGLCLTSRLIWLDHRDWRRWRFRLGVTV